MVCLFTNKARNIRMAAVIENVALVKKKDILFALLVM